MEKPLLTVLLPTYNESKNINELLAQIVRHLDELWDESWAPFEILFIDDSTDDTQSIIAEEVASNPQIRMVHRPPANRNGLAGAFVDGFKYANGEYICCMDADLQHPPSAIPLLLEKIISEKADLVIGSRYIKGGSAEGLGTRYRKLVSIFAKHTARIFLFPMKLGSDPGSGFFIVKKETLNGIDLRPRGFKILIEILAKANISKVVEVPINFAPRENNESKASFSQGIEFLKHLFLVFFQAPRAGRFIKFCIVGSIGAAINLSCLYLLVEYAHFGPVAAWGYAVAIGIINNFSLNSMFTFSDYRVGRTSKIVSRFIRFFFGSLVGLGINFCVYRILLYAHVYYIFAAALGILAGMAMNFAIAHYLIWKKETSSQIAHEPWKIWNGIFNKTFFSFLLCAVILGILVIFGLDEYRGLSLLNYFIPTFSILVSIQGLIALFLMYYGWEDPTRFGLDSSPKVFLLPKFSFTAIIPARHEENVIGDTIRAVADINYPENMKEVLIICRKDDEGTIQKAGEAIALFPKKNITVIVFDGDSENKPHALNIALRAASKDLVAIFDAEDEPHADIFNIVNTVMLRDDVDVVQSGVQLMNYRSRWFSMFNVVEYYFWFKSTLHFFAKSYLIPLGGNTVFFKKDFLEKVGGWDENCLTEDADIGIRLSLAGAKTRVVYDEQHVTKEETPDTMAAFIKQRTRWNQGFLQILFKRDWMRLPRLSQRLLAFYVLTCPFIQAIMFLYVPIAIWMIFMVKLPALIALIALMPLFVLFLHFITYLIGLYEFSQDYKLPFPFWLPIKALIFYYPFQILMGVSVFRAIIRVSIGTNIWEKTEHLNLHRSQEEPSLSSATPIKIS